LEVAGLHLLQPWARWWRRLQSKRERRAGGWPRRAEGVLWAGWDRREEWLRRLAALLRSVGMEVREGDERGGYDLRVGAYPGHTVLLESVVERGAQIRFRARVGTSLRLRLIEAVLLLGMIATCAAPPCLPLLLPLAGLYYR
jgi:hypothetical protein